MGKRNLFAAVFDTMKSLFQEQQRRDKLVDVTTTLGPLYPPLKGTRLLPGPPSYHADPRPRGMFGAIADKRLFGRGTSLDERKAMRRGGHADPRWDAAW